MAVCEHIDALSEIKSSASGVCDACVLTGDRWVHLRVCQSCGATLCCDSSPNQHASKHCRESGHPVVSSAEPGENWVFCYPDNKFARY